MTASLKTNKPSLEKFADGDPTRSKTLRREYAGAIRKRFRRIRGLIRRVINEERALGLDRFATSGRRNIDRDDLDFDVPDQFPVQTAGELTRQFRRWLKRQQDKGVLEVVRQGGINSPIEEKTGWEEVYVRRAYAKGLHQANQKLLAAGIPEGKIPQEALEQAFNRPIHAQKLADLYRRNFNALQTVKQAGTEEAAQIFREELTEGVARGFNPRKIGDNIVNRVNSAYGSLTENRANLVARTEVINSHAEATLNRYEEAGVQRVQGQAEFMATADDKTCPLCLSLQGQTLPIKEARNIIPVHPRCYDDQTEVYTNRGWVNFKELKGDEKILSMNPESEELEIGWKPYKHKIAYHYQGNMVRLKSNSYDMLVTPNHRSLYGVRSDNDDRSHVEWKLDSTAQMMQKSSFKLPRTGSWEGRDPEKIQVAGMRFDPEKFAYFMGIYLSEGSAITDRDTVSITQHGEQANEMYQEVKELPYNVTKTDTKIRFRDEQLCLWLSKFGHSHEKYVPEIIRELCPRLIKIFLEAYIDGDGTRKTCKWEEKDLEAEEKSITTSSERMAETIGECILKAGGYPSFYKEEKAGKKQEFDNGTYEINNDQWRIHWRKSETACYQASEDYGIEMSLEDYEGIVYDVELPEWHVLWVRRNGKTGWSGNCRCSWTPITTLSEPFAGKQQFARKRFDQIGMKPEDINPLDPSDPATQKALSRFGKLRRGTLDLEG